MGASRCRRDRMHTRFLAGRSRTMPVQHFLSAANCVYSSSSSSAALFRSEASVTARRLPVSALTVLFWCDANWLVARMGKHIGAGERNYRRNTRDKLGLGVALAQ